MIKEHLDARASEHLAELVAKWGEPEHPAFLIWSSGGFSVLDISPFTIEDLTILNPDQLFNRIKDWHPNPDELFGPERISYSGLANKITGIILADIDRFESRLLDILLLRPEYAISFFGQLGNVEQIEFVQWKIVIKSL